LKHNDIEISIIDDRFVKAANERTNFEVFNLVLTKDGYRNLHDHQIKNDTVKIAKLMSGY